MDNKSKAECKQLGCIAEPANHCSDDRASKMAGQKQCAVQAPALFREIRNQARKETKSVQFLCSHKLGIHRRYFDLSIATRRPGPARGNTELLHNIFCLCHNSSPSTFFHGAHRDNSYTKKCHTSGHGHNETVC